LTNLNIKYLLNMTHECQNHFENNKGMHLNYHRAALYDANDEELQDVFGEAFSVLEKAKVENERILVFCNEGRSRSCSLVIAWLMFDQRNTLLEAFTRVKTCRTIARPNSSFFEQLIEYEVNLFGKSTANQSTLLSYYVNK